ncbi:MAG: hypothetical protein ACYC0J_05800 [Gammaproteobacteria bacterium]
MFDRKEPFRPLEQDDVVIFFNDKETRLAPLAKLEKRVSTRQMWSNIWYGSSSLILLATMSIGIFLLYYLATQRRSLRNVYEAEMDASLAAISNTIVAPPYWGEKLSCTEYRYNLNNCDKLQDLTRWKEWFLPCVKAGIPFCQAKAKLDAGTLLYDGGIAVDVLSSITLLLTATCALFLARKWKHKLLDKPVDTFLPEEVDSLKYAMDMFDLPYSRTEGIHSAVQRVNIEREKEKCRTAFLGIGYFSLAAESSKAEFKALLDVVRGSEFDRTVLGKIFEYADLLPDSKESLKSFMAWGSPVYHRDSRVVDIDRWLLEKNNSPASFN